MSRRPTRREIAEQDQSLLLRQQNFRHAADAVAAALAQFPEVRAIALFGSVARPLWREVPRFSDYRRHRIEVWHECKDVDLAVAYREVVSLLDDLCALALSQGADDKFARRLAVLRRQHVAERRFIERLDAVFGPPRGML
jgi:predicted nucleotidyltransferase